MAKLSSNAITQSDVKEYLGNYSDFSFELRVLKEFVTLGLDCLHGGTYEDPLTKKSREFDIRALLENGWFRIHLSIECKNLHEYFPLIVHCTKRKFNESYNELIYTYKEKASYMKLGAISLPIPGIPGISKSIRVERFSLYPTDDFVAKSTDQIGRKDTGEISTNDLDVFDKISQAINSAVDLISEAHYLDTTVTHPL